jgi:hypothetical protein
MLWIFFESLFYSSRCVLEDEFWALIHQGLLGAHTHIGERSL